MAFGVYSPFFFQVSTAGFSEGAFVSNPDTRWGRFWGYVDARRVRYETYWGYFENNVYRNIHLWSPALKEQFQLYRSIRSIYSPAYRIGEFWAEHIFGGILDCEAGDGQDRPSAIPIRTALEGPAADALRAAIGLIWEVSNWQANKDTLARFGAVMGDVGLMPFDDPGRKQVSLRVIHPRSICELDRDGQGNAKAYVIEERRLDPRVEDPTWYPGEVTYKEVCTKVGRRVRFETFLDGEPYDWRDYPYDDSRRIGPDWTEDYGFVPLVFVQHRDVGLGWGWSEYQPGASKLMEVDDLASKISDQVRKLVDSPWLFAGCDKQDIEISYGDPDDGDPSPERTKVPILYAGDPAVKATPLVAPLDLAGASAWAERLLDKITQDYPELVADDDASGNASGRARRVAREKVEARVVARRAGYDDALARAQMMCISIGAQKRYPGFEAFDGGSYERGDLQHTIGDRPVFAVDELDHIEEVTARASALKALTDSGMPLKVAMEVAGYPEDLIARIPAEAAPPKTTVGMPGLPRDPTTLDANPSRDVNGPVEPANGQAITAA